MKINDQQRYPHPVLTTFTDDFLNSTITFAVEVEEVPATTTLYLTCTLEADNSDLIASIRDGYVGSYVNIVCLPTYFNEFYEISLGTSTVDVAPGLLRGQTQVSALLVAK